MLFYPAFGPDQFVIAQDLDAPPQLSPLTAETLLPWSPLDFADTPHFIPIIAEYFDSMSSSSSGLKICIYPSIFLASNTHRTL